MHLEVVDGTSSSLEFLDVDDFIGTAFIARLFLVAHFLGGVFIFSCMESIEYSSKRSFGHYPFWESDPIALILSSYA